MTERDRIAMDGFTTANLKEGLNATAGEQVIFKKSFTTANLQDALKPSGQAPAPSAPPSQAEAATQPQGQTAKPAK